MQGENVPPAAPRDTRLTYDDFLLFPGQHSGTGQVFMALLDVLFTK